MMTLEDCGPRISETEIISLEGILGSPLPADYREFLIVSNGGLPKPDAIDIPGYPESPTDVQVLFGVGRSVESSRLEWNLRTLSERLDPELLPIACDSGGNVFCLSLRAFDNGTVLYCDLQTVSADEESKPRYYSVASSFDSFLHKLRPLM